MVGYAFDYKSGHETGLHRHPRAQLLFATAGVMRVTTESALFTVPPGTGLWVPADTTHGVRMDGDVCMRALFLRADAAASGPPDHHGDRRFAVAARADPDGVRRAGGVGCARPDQAGRGAGAA